MDPAVVAAIVAACTSVAILGGKEGITGLRQRHESKERRQQVRQVVLGLYRNAVIVLDRAMYLGYLDEPGQMESTLRLLLERIVRDDIAGSFEPKRSDLIQRSVPLLLGAVHGCLRAHDYYISSGSPDAPDAVAAYNDQIRQSAGSALAFTTLVLTELGDKEFWYKNVTEINMHRIQQYMNDEAKVQAAEKKRDEEILRTQFGKEPKKSPPDEATGEVRR